jgi:hypothetical protein
MRNTTASASRHTCTTSLMMCTGSSLTCTTGPHAFARILKPRPVLLAPPMLQPLVWAESSLHRWETTGSPPCSGAFPFPLTSSGRS